MHINVCKGQLQTCYIHKCYDTKLMRSKKSLQTHRNATPFPRSVQSVLMGTAFQIY